MRRKACFMVAATCMTALLLVVGLTFLTSFAEVSRVVIEELIPNGLNVSWVSYKNYYMVGVGILLVFWCALVVALGRMVLKKPITHDLQYVQGVLRSQNKRIAIVSVLEATLTMLGSKSSGEAQREVGQLLRRNFEPIREFLMTDVMDRDVLVVSAPWGDGKTSNVLMAVDSLGYDIQVNRRYIYASAFRYTNGIREFNRDIIKSLEDVLLEWGIEDRKGFAALLNNLESDMSKTVIEMLKAVINSKEMLITEELIYGINNSYVKAFKKEKQASRPQLIIIIDDMDRVLGEDIIRILSLLSVLRRFTFVKIIIPMETKAVIQQLEKMQIYHPEKYLNKYLPEQYAVKLRSQFQIVEEILLRQIRRQAGEYDRGVYRYRAVLAAVLIKCLVDILEGDMDNWKGEVAWNVMSDSDPFHMEWGLPRGISDVSALILGKVERGLVNSLNSDVAKGKYVPCSDGLSRMKRFEQIFNNILYKYDGILAKTIARYNRGEGAVASCFTDEVYRDTVEGWIFNFAGENWNKLGITLRDLKDTLVTCDLSNMGVSSGAQFCAVFNQLFENEHLVYSKNGKINALK